MTIKHRVQNPRRVTSPMSIASTHAQICPRNIMCGASYTLIASVELRELACTSRVAPRFLASDRKFFDDSSLLVRFRCLRVRSNLPLCLRSTCLCSPSPQRRPRIAVKGISRNNFRRVRFYRTPHILNLVFIVKNTYV